MNASRITHQRNALLAAESLLVIATLIFVSAIAPVQAIVSNLGPDGEIVEPTPTDPCASIDPSASTDPTVSPDPSASPAAVDAGLHVDHFWVDAIDPATGVNVPGGIDAPAVGVERARLYVVRFQVVNDSSLPIELLPVMEFQGDASKDAWTAVPAVDPVLNVPFYTSSNVLMGEAPGTEAVPVSSLRLATILEANDPLEVVPCGTDQHLPTELPGTTVPAATDGAPSPIVDEGATTADPTVDPTLEPTAEPTADPTLEPTAEPTADPTAGPTVAPTLDATADPAPTSASTPAPTESARLAAAPVVGVAHAGVNPGPVVKLAGHGFTELSFTIRATADAAWLATYAVRLSNGDTPTPGAGVATLVMRDSPPVVLSPGQQSGVEVDPFPLYPLRAPGAAFRSFAVGLDDAATTTAGPLAFGLLGPPFTSPHEGYTLTTDACAACHATHAAQSRMLLVSPEPLSAMCLACHNGDGATSNIAAQYADPSIPPNDPTTDSYFSHAATTPSNHTSDRDAGEFAGVLNRHTACTDCHQPHNADASLATETAAGWTASGALKGASGVAVQYDPVGTTPPTYTWTPSSQFEYQLCFKCHSGFTQLNAQTGGPSTWALDKAVELNPANLSYHPVEAQGKNQTAQMGRSLGVLGTSPYKLWAFTTTSTIRCVNCHGDSRLADPLSPPDAGARLAPHAVANRGMLIANLRDRDLIAPSEAYDAADFALCYVCHAEAPFVDTSMNSTLESRFRNHGSHVAGHTVLVGPPPGTVDDDGAGRGSAICAECHFRTHGTTYAVDGQPPTSRLVNFAPNVQPYQGVDPLYQGVLKWDDSTSHPTCTLTCHGIDHKAWSY